MFVRKAAVLFTVLMGLMLAPSLSLANVPGVPTAMPGASMASDDDAAMPSAVPMPPAAAARQGQQTATSSAYVLGTGDRIKLIVFGETDISGEYEVGSTGIVAVPLVGDVLAAGHSVTDFEQAVRQKLAQGYLRDPRVSAQVINYRPFFILGEVSKPGSYPYVNGMTVVSAVALAGGYTYRADRDGITIKRANDREKKEVSISEEATVSPGDIIRVPERFF